MKITITAVSVPALRQIQAFRKRYEQQYPEDDLTIVCFYVAGQEQRYVLEPERIIQDMWIPWGLLKSFRRSWQKV